MLNSFSSLLKKKQEAKTRQSQRADGRVVTYLSEASVPFVMSHKAVFEKLAFWHKLSDVKNWTSVLKCPFSQECLHAIMWKHMNHNNVGNILLLNSPCNWWASQRQSTLTMLVLFPLSGWCASTTLTPRRRPTLSVKWRLGQRQKERSVCMWQLN